MFNPRDHCVGAYFRSGGNGTRDVGHEDRTLGVGRAAVVTKTPIGAGRAIPVRRTERGDGGGRDGNAQSCAAANEYLGGGVQLVLALRVSSAPPTPGVKRRPGDLQRLLDLFVVRL